MNKHIHNLTLDDIKNIIREEGGYISCVDMKGPVTVLFMVHDAPNYKDNIYTRYSVECTSFNLSEKGIEGFRQFIRNVIDSDFRTAVFCPYSIVTDNNGDILFRLAFFNNHLFQREITIEEAKKLIENPPDNVSQAYFIHDIKTIYGL